MYEMVKIPTYSMKMQLYPSAAQKESIDRIFRALHLAYNITFHEVFQKNPEICTKANDKGAIWPDFKKMATSKWRHFLISQNPLIEDAPSASLLTQNGLFALDGKRAWETGMHNAPIEADNRKNFRFYNTGHPRRSFLVQIDPEKLVPSSDNAKVAWITIPKVGKVKARGFNRRLYFGESGHHNYLEALTAGELPTNLTIRVSKDTCGDYFVSITFSEGKKKDRQLYLEMPAAREKVPMGIDVGIKDIAILSTGQKIENKHFKKKKDPALRRLGRKLSRRWGPANMAYRDYNSTIRKENRQNPSSPKPMAKPSKRYLATQHKRALTERKITRQRNTYYHQQTAAIIRSADMIAIETLHVKNMLRNHKLAFALADAAMSDFLAKLKYKAERSSVVLRAIGTFEPSSQLCSNCGAQYPPAKNLAVRVWTCPSCGVQHDRDINAARNILYIAQTKQNFKDDPPEKTRKDEKKPPPPGRPRNRKGMVIFADRPEIVVALSNTLTSYNNPRYIILNTKTNVILDDAQGIGYKSASNAKNCYKAKIKYSAKNNSPAKQN